MYFGDESKYLTRGSHCLLSCKTTFNSNRDNICLNDLNQTLWSVCNKTKNWLPCKCYRVNDYKPMVGCIESMNDVSSQYHPSLGSRYRGVTTTVPKDYNPVRDLNFFAREIHHIFMEEIGAYDVRSTVFFYNSSVRSSDGSKILNEPEVIYEFQTIFEVSDYIVVCYADRLCQITHTEPYPKPGNSVTKAKSYPLGKRLDGSLSKNVEDKSGKYDFDNNFANDARGSTGYNLTTVKVMGLIDSEGIKNSVNYSLGNFKKVEGVLSKRNPTYSFTPIMLPFSSFLRGIGPSTKIIYSAIEDYSKKFKPKSDRIGEKNTKKHSILAEKLQKGEIVRKLILNYPGPNRDINSSFPIKLTKADKGKYIVSSRDIEIEYHYKNKMLTLLLVTFLIVVILTATFSVILGRALQQNKKRKFRLKCAGFTKETLPNTSSIFDDPERRLVITDNENISMPSVIELSRRSSAREWAETSFKG
ncbi:unnamed protein product [Gordionus sp. m RMFG-2023]